MIRHTHISRSSYYDSVILMRIASKLKKEDGVREVAMFMGTEGNHELLDQAGLATDESKIAGPQDLIIIVEATTEDLARAVSEDAVAQLNARVAQGNERLDYRPRTIESACRILPEASLAAISVPGEYAAREARRCIGQGLNVFLFSDNVSIEDEVALKKKALENGVLCMGPDCGTAYINGVALGFANKVKPGRIGCVAASGTGLQAVVCRLDELGEGISHAIGVGGRDLHSEVGGLMTVRALELLEQDLGTEIIIVISKPPHMEMLNQIEVMCSRMSTPVVACFQGAKFASKHMLQASTVDDAAALAVATIDTTPFVPHLSGFHQTVGKLVKSCGDISLGKGVMGLYTGGTLAKEAQLLLSERLGSVTADLDNCCGHVVVDLGDDKFTVGRPHPMIAPETRTEILRDLAEKGILAECGVLLVDVLLGYGAYMDPAGELVRGVAMVQQEFGLRFNTVVALIATEEDPQNTLEQISQLESAGMIVFRINSEAACFSGYLVDRKGFAVSEK